MRSPFIRRVRETPARRRVANASVVSAIALGVVGVMLGTGIAGTAVGVSDGMTWLADSHSGEVLQYNPGTKRVERAYQVAQPGDEISVAQDSGIVALRNQRTGEVVTVDLSRLRATGARAAGGPSKVLVSKGMMVLVDRDRGILRRIDPVKAGDVGEVWKGPAPVADAVADQQGTVWVMAADGNLRALAWNDQAQRFDETSVKRINRITDDGQLAAHPTGVTVFGPRAGVMAQIGTANDGYRQSNQLVGIAPQATEGSSDLVAGALPDQAAVVILDWGEIRQISTAELGCLRPTDPAAFNNRVYVVCQGNRKVIQLTRDGRVAGPEISTPGNEDAQPVADEGRLVLNVSGAGQGIEIDRAGSDKRFDRTPDGETQSLRVQVNPANQGIEVGRQQARSDLAQDPLPGQPDSGSGNVKTNPDTLENRTEVVDGRGSRSEPSDDEVAVPEIAAEIPAPAAVDSPPASSGTNRPVPRRSGTAADSAPPAPTPEQNGPASAPTAASTSKSAPAPTRAATNRAPISSGSESAASAPSAPVAPEPVQSEPVQSEPVQSEPVQSEPVQSEAVQSEAGPAASDPEEPTQSEPAPTELDPGETGPPGPVPSEPVPTGSVPVPAASTEVPLPSAAPSGPEPTATASPAPTATAPATGPAPTATSTPTPTSTATAFPAGTTVPTPVQPTSTTQVTPTPTAPPLAAPASLAATASGNAVTATWAYSGDVDHFDVTVGGRTVQVVGSARTATVTGIDPRATQVIVTAVRGDAARSADTTVTVAPTATPTTTTTPTEPADAG